VSLKTFRHNRAALKIQKSGNIATSGCPSNKSFSAFNHEAHKAPAYEISTKSGNARLSIGIPPILRAAFTRMGSELRELNHQNLTLKNFVLDFRQNVVSFPNDGGAENQRQNSDFWSL